jgi:hypothetical protein
MKSLHWIVIILFLIASPFLAAFFWENYTAAAIGVVFVGIAGNIIMYDLGAKSRSMVYMWIAIILIIAVLLGIEYILPKISFKG